MWNKEYLKLLRIDETSISNKTPFELLEEIITNHQMFITYDTLRKSRDFNSPLDIKNKYINISNYIISVKRNGLGGTCFHLTWSLYNLLIFLNFEVKILKMEYQHFALAVVIDSKEYYIDVGFWSPLFKPLPLRENWKIEKGASSVEWKKSNNSWELFWNNKPAKRWHEDFIDVKTFFYFWEKSMTESNYFLNNLYINKWKDSDTFMFLVNEKFTEFYKGNKIEEINFSSLDEALNIIKKKFDVIIYKQDLLNFYHLKYSQNYNS